MKSSLRPGLFLMLGIALILTVVWINAAEARKAAVEARNAAAADPVSGPRYTVISTDGAHLIVTDNGTNKLYFYAIDKDGKIGDELKLRGSADLTEVGKPGIKPIDAKPQK
jgi:hypothetical protein